MMLAQKAPLPAEPFGLTNDWCPARAMINGARATRGLRKTSACNAQAKAD